MAKTAGDGPASEQLARLAQGLGIDPSTVGGGGGRVTVDPKDPTVFMGDTGTPEYRADGDVLRHRGGKKQGGRRSQTKSLSAANAAFYEMEREDVIELQRRLVAAGILDRKTVRYGDYDEDTYSAFKGINERTARFNAVGKRLTPNDVLAMIEQSSQENGAGPAEPVEPGRISPIESPATLRLQAEQAAERELGRRFRPDEAEDFVRVYQAMQSQWTATAGAMSDSAAISGEDVEIEALTSPDVAADQYVRSNFAQEAAGQDAYGYLRALRGLLEGAA